MPIQTDSRRYFKAFLWVVEFDGFDEMRFEKCSPLKVTFENIERRQGGTLFPDHSAGLGKVDPVTLERGAIVGNKDFYNWIELVGSMVVARGSGAVDAAYKKNGRIQQLDRDGVTVLRAWTIRQAFPTEWEYGGWDASQSADLMEKLVIQPQSFTPTEGSL